MGYPLTISFNCYPYSLHTMIIVNRPVTFIFIFPRIMILRVSLKSAYLVETEIFLLKVR